MFKLVLIVLFLKVVNSALILPNRDSGVKNCVKEIMKNWIDADTTVVYVYFSDSRDVLPDGMLNPIISINGNNSEFHLNGYETHKELIVININDASLLVAAAIKLLKSGIDKFEATPERKFLIICPIDNDRMINNAFRVFSFRYNFDVIILATKYRDLHNMIIIRDHHQADDCGRDKKNMKIMEERMCGPVIIPKPNLLKKYSNCTITLHVMEPRRMQKHWSEIDYINFMFIDVLKKNFNVRVVQTYGTARYIFFGLNNMRSCTTLPFHCTFPFYVDSWAWIVPSPKQIDPLEVFKIIFKKTVWISIFLAFFIVAVVWWLIRKCERAVSFTAILLDIYSITIFGFINKFPSFPALRILFVTYVIYSIHIQSIFSSNLVRLLTVPHYERVLETVEEIALSNIPVKITKDLLQLFKYEKNDTLYDKIKKKLVTSYMLDQTFDNYSMFLPKHGLPAVARHRQQKFQVVIDDTIIGQEFTSYGVSTLFLLPIINKFVSVLTESGIIDHEQRKYQAFLKNISHFYDNKLNVTDQKVVITLEHVYPVFVFWGAGICIATAVFFGEVLTYVVSNKLKKRN